MGWSRLLRGIHLVSPLTPPCRLLSRTPLFRYDLYTKQNEYYTPEEEASLRAYYTGLVTRFVPGPLHL